MNVLSSADSNQTVSPHVRERIRALGLNIETVLTHQRNIRAHLLSGKSKFFRIVDCCRLENAGIQPLPRMKDTGAGTLPVVAFVPAAGASSRYLLPLESLIGALRDGQSDIAFDAVKQLITNNVAACPLPDSFRRLLSLIQSGSSAIPEELREQVLLDVEAPKALYPAVVDGVSFAEIKRVEHQALGGLAGEVYVCPPGKKEHLERVLKSVDGISDVRCYEQGPSLATVRFDEAAQVALDSGGNPSPVPAGHGSLIHLFPAVKNDFPAARGLFIRNIDNVSGTSDPVIAATRNFISVFSESLRAIDSIRSAVQKGDQLAAEKFGQQLLRFWGINAKFEENPLQMVLSNLFHSKMSQSSVMDAGVWSRPFVMMGQVPNTQKDVGGTCVFAEVDGVMQKLCLEVPHASPEDRKKFLEDPGLATHFNPVFVAAEIPDSETLSCWGDHPFWLVAKKSWRGLQVYYQESILYELLGSSAHCNVIFTEVPRSLFNPHKTLFDAAGKTSKYWLG